MSQALAHSGCCLLSHPDQSHSPGLWHTPTIQGLPQSLRAPCVPLLRGRTGDKPLAGGGSRGDAGRALQGEGAEPVCSS